MAKRPAAGKKDASFYLLNGWTMMADGCSVCFHPLYHDKRRTGKIMCANCDIEVEMTAQGLRQDSEQRSGTGGLGSPVLNSTFPTQEDAIAQRETLLDDSGCADEDDDEAFGHGLRAAMAHLRADNEKSEPFPKHAPSSLGHAQPLHHHQQAAQWIPPTKSEPIPIPTTNFQPATLPALPTSHHQANAAPHGVQPPVPSGANPILAEAARVLLDKIRVATEALARSTDANQDASLCFQLSGYAQSLKYIGDAQQSIKGL